MGSVVRAHLGSLFFQTDGMGAKAMTKKVGSSSEPVVLKPSAKRAVRRLCKVMVSLKRKERSLADFFNNNEEPSIEEIYHVEQAILDLCRVPHQWARDGFGDIFSAPFFPEKKFTNDDLSVLLARIDVMRRLESITYGEGQTIQKVEPPELLAEARRLLTPPTRADDFAAVAMYESSRSH
jgi:hypothetical protein